MAEPGRFFVATAATLVAEVLGKAIRYEKPFYYINDGVYNSFSGFIFDHIQYHIKAFKSGPTQSSIVVGPTCDALDKISIDEQLPDLKMKDLVYAENMGAYTNASATKFNGFLPAKILNINIKMD
jgi:ornithine decarboxylase